MTEELRVGFRTDLPIRSISLRVRKIYYDQIVAGTKTFEVRKYSDYWRKRLWDVHPRIAVFVCGKRVHRRVINSIWVDTPERALGRELSEQGKKDVDTEYCYVIGLGKEIK